MTETAAADVTIWSADMTVVEYSSRSIGAGTADLFSNQMGRAGLRAKYLWYDPDERVLRIGFDAGLYDAEPLTLHLGAVSLGFPDDPGGDASFTLRGVDLSWTDGETLQARISKPSASAVSTDATLASLGVEGATLSPAFDAGVVLYWAVADAGAETVTVSARANDDGATVAYGPAADAAAELADHQVAASTEGDFLVVVTVTAADGTVRRYRVVVAPTATEPNAAEPNAAPTGLPTSGTPQVGQPLTADTTGVEQTLTADTSAIADQDGLTNVSYSYQWIAGGSDIGGATGSTHTLTASEQGQTIAVRVTFTDDADNAETLTSEATVEVTAAPVALTVSVTVSAPASHDGSSEFTFDIEFSEEFGLSYRTLKNHAFNVTGGSVERAQRTDKPSNIHWRITIKPQGKRGRDHRAPGNHGLQRRRRHLHWGRQETVQLAELHRVGAGGLGPAQRKVDLVSFMGIAT